MGPRQGAGNVGRERSDWPTLHTALLLVVYCIRMTEKPGNLGLALSEIVDIMAYVM